MISSYKDRIQILTSLLGTSAVMTFAISFILIAGLNPDFKYGADYITKLGAPAENSVYHVKS